MTDLVSKGSNRPSGCSARLLAPEASHAELGCLKNEGCDEGQGYLFGRPRPQADVLEGLAAAERAVRAA